MLDGLPTAMAPKDEVRWDSWGVALPDSGGNSFCLAIWFVCQAQQSDTRPASTLTPLLGRLGVDSEAIRLRGTCTTTIYASKEMGVSIAGRKMHPPPPILYLKDAGNVAGLCVDDVVLCCRLDVVHVLDADEHPADQKQHKDVQ